MHTELDAKTQKCVDDCGKCYQSCLKTFCHCLSMGDKHANWDHIMLLKDCAEICATMESFLLRCSSHAECISSECAKICEECAASCEKIGPEDLTMKECAKICRECAASCKEM